ncbi:MAG: prepilin-type N-terminal cleavage/methylation domain-containing protein [Bradyrhizobium sp.]|nr:prepilin-type N-terminal cleavage/methylation domain-containing protein [Pseudomonadota bacterium]MDE2471419.1 prepilin-type N-terminal cleavage/methylation domain-containing protein [Bradyrhizobium sp.]
MSTHRNEIGNSAAGFTLIEMLVVLAILALTTVFAMPLLSGGSDGVRLDTTISDLSAALRVTRAAAIASNRPLALIVDVEQRTFRSNVVSRRSFPSDIEAKLTYASIIRSAVSEGGFQFFPDGSSTGGEIDLSLRGRQEKLCIDWLTGIVRKAAICGTS